MVAVRGGRREWEERGNSAGFIIIGRWSSASGIGKTDAAVYSPTDERRTERIGENNCKLYNKQNEKKVLEAERSDGRSVGGLRLGQRIFDVENLRQSIIQNKLF